MGFTDVVSSGIGAIRSIAGSYQEKGVERSVYGIVELLMIIWTIRILAEAKEDEATIELLDKELRESTVWQREGAEDLVRIFEQSKGRLKRELLDVGSSMFDDPTSSLRRLLLTKYPAMLQQIMEELYPSRDVRG